MHPSLKISACSGRHNDFTWVFGIDQFRQSLIDPIGPSSPFWSGIVELAKQYHQALGGMHIIILSPQCFRGYRVYRNGAEWNIEWASDTKWSTLPDSFELAHLDSISIFVESLYQASVYDPLFRCPINV